MAAFLAILWRPRARLPVSDEGSNRALRCSYAVRRGRSLCASVARITSLRLWVGSDFVECDRPNDIRVEGFKKHSRVPYQLVVSSLQVPPKQLRNFDVTIPLPPSSRAKSTLQPPSEIFNPVRERAPVKIHRKRTDGGGDFFMTSRTPAAASCVCWLPGVSTTARRQVLEKSEWRAETHES